jgi:galactokinase/mevalonate kinase-like predicted kinase
MIRASAPGRCGLVGNPTDGYGGTVISSSLAERAVVEITPADDAIRLDICGQQELIGGVEDLRFTGSLTDAAKAVFTLFDSVARERRFRLKARTTIPLQAGLGGSTAMITAILGATLRMLEIPLSPYEIAETVRHVEFNIMNCVCGFQDQYMAAFGGIAYLDFRDKDPHGGKDPVFATVESLEPFLGDLPLILANTGVQRHSGTVHQGLRERWIQGDRDVTGGYDRIARLAREAKKALVAGDWACVGAAMNENHAIQRDLGGSGEENERLIAAALQAGAAGAKLAGAGRGGTIIAVHEDPDYLCRRLEEAGAERILRVAPSEGLVVEGQI